MVVALIWCLLILVPINGALYMGARNERIKARKALMGYWKLYKQRKG